jgi:Thermostable hemolysin
MFIAVPRSDRLRPIVEGEIQRLYWKRYGACLASFAPTIVAELNDAGKVECAAGIRFAGERLFLECYLDQPIEMVLQDRLGAVVKRDHIVEVCHLAGVGSGRSQVFVRKLIGLLRAMDAEWAIFTATRPLRCLLAKSGLSMIELGRASIRCVSRPDMWGSYYENDPRIMAISRSTPHDAKRTFPIVAPSQGIDAHVF